MGMRIAKADQADLDAATKLYQLLSAIDGGSFPPESEDEDWLPFDEDDREHLQRFMKEVMDCYNHPPSGLMRVLMAASCALDEKNAIFDPNKTYLDFHPRFIEMEEKLRRCAEAMEANDPGNYAAIFGDKTAPPAKEPSTPAAGESQEARPDGCVCHQCIQDFKLTSGDPGDSLPLSSTRMIVCPECHNKRCPKASNHRLPCTGSNDPGQPGSIYQ